MNQYKSISELKNISKRQISGHFGFVIGASAIQFIITFICADFVSSLTQATGSVGYVINYICSFAVQILSFIFQIGLYLIYMKVACNMPSTMSDLFYGFKKYSNTFLIIGFVFCVINAICMIPSDIVTYQFEQALNTISLPSIESLYNPENIGNTEQLTLLYSFYSAYINLMLVTCGCSILYFVVTLPFFPIPYMLIDFPNYSVKELFKTSLELMKGNMLRYVTLILSFIPIMLLSFVTCGIALIWIIPYMHMASATFYLDLVSVRNKTI